MIITISDMWKNQQKMLDNDNQIKLSSLIVFLVTKLYVGIEVCVAAPLHVSEVVRPCVCALNCVDGRSVAAASSTTDARQLGHSRDAP